MIQERIVEALRAERDSCEKERNDNPDGNEVQYLDGMTDAFRTAMTIVQREFGKEGGDAV